MNVSGQTCLKSSDTSCYFLPFLKSLSSNDILGFQCSTTVINYNDICYKFKHFKAIHKTWSTKDTYY